MACEPILSFNRLLKTYNSGGWLFASVDSAKVFGNNQATVFKIKLVLQSQGAICSWFSPKNLE
jgi:hypothetical protein